MIDEERRGVYGVLVLIGKAIRGLCSSPDRQAGCLAAFKAWLRFKERSVRRFRHGMGDLRIAGHLGLGRSMGNLAALWHSRNCIWEILG